jgi:cytochrome P450
MGEVMGPVMGRTILEMGGHAHTVHRGLVSHAFRPKAIEEYGRRIVEPLVDELVESLAARAEGRADLVADLTATYPIRVIAALLGLPVEDYPLFQEWSFGIIGFRLERPEAGLAASRAIREYLTPIIRQRRAEPRGDIISDLAAAEIGGERLSDDDILGFLLLLLPAGAETTFRLLGNVLFALLSHPEQLEEVRADPAELPWALEETLRWETPLLGTARVTTREVTLRGVTIPEAFQVSPMIGPANRDEEHYPDPDRFDMHRHATDHLSFGLGKHFCLGYHLARLEVLTAVRAVLERLPNLRLDPAEDCYIRGIEFRSPNRLAVRFDSR